MVLFLSKALCGGPFAGCLCGGLYYKQSRNLSTNIGRLPRLWLLGGTILRSEAPSPDYLNYSYQERTLFAWGDQEGVQSRDIQWVKDRLHRWSQFFRQSESRGIRPRIQIYYTPCLQEMLHTRGIGRSLALWVQPRSVHRASSSGIIASHWGFTVWWARLQ